MKADHLKQRVPFISWNRVFRAAPGRSASTLRVKVSQGHALTGEDLRAIDDILTGIESGLRQLRDDIQSEL